MRDTFCRSMGVIVLAWAGMATAVGANHHSPSSTAAIMRSATVPTTRANDDSPLRVDGRGGGDYTTIQAAIDAAQPGDEIAVAPGTYREAIDFHGKAIRLYSLEGAESTILDGTGHPHVVLCRNEEGPDTILEGFTITGGDAWDYYESAGAGLSTTGAPTVTRCRFIRNGARFGGAVSGRAAISHCLFQENDARMGGALYQAGTVTDSTFIGNTGDMGGAINKVQTVTRCTFIANVECIFEAGLVADCVFRENYGGPALGNAERVTNCVFVDNGYAMVTRIDLHSTVTHCTFLNNEVALTHGQNGVTTLANCIIWGSAWAAIEGPAIVTFSNIQGGWDGQGNITVDPLFADDEGRLLPGSPCIDAGTNDPPGGLPLMDLAGNPRPADGDADGLAIADMGAYERPDPAQLLEILIDTVAGLKLPRATGNCLLKRLDLARKAMENRSETNDQIAAIHLTSFINLVEGPQGTAIPQPDAEALVAAAQQIIDLLDGSETGGSGLL